MKVQETRCHDCPYAVENSTSKKLLNLKKSYTNVLLYPKKNGDLFIRNVMHKYTDEDLNRFISFDYHCLRVSGRIMNFTKRGFVLTAWKVTNLEKDNQKEELVRKALELTNRTATYGMYSNPPQMPDTTSTTSTTSTNDSTNSTKASDINNVDNYKDTDSIRKEDSNK